jgi:hypothetical protein
VIFKVKEIHLMEEAQAHLHNLTMKMKNSSFCDKKAERKPRQPLKLFSLAEILHNIHSFAKKF